jgi:hypothetical protein
VCLVELVQAVRVEPVIAGTAQGRLFRFLLQRYHYLGHRNCVGENLKYLACDRAAFRGLATETPEARRRLTA